MKKMVLIVAFIVIVLILTTMIAIDAKLVKGLILQKTSENKYTATFKNISPQGKVYSVIYVPKERLHPYFGKAFYEFGNGIALVRYDLPKSVQAFVLRHELYHLQDYKHKNTISREIHATLAGLPYSPVGFVKTAFMSLTSKDRLGVYTKLISKNLGI